MHPGSKKDPQDKTYPRENFCVVIVIAKQGRRIVHIREAVVKDVFEEVQSILTNNYACSV